MHGREHEFLGLGFIVPSKQEACVVNVIFLFLRCRVDVGPADHEQFLRFVYMHLIVPANSL